MKSRSAKGTVRPPDPQEVIRRRASTGRAKIRVIADRDDANEPQLEVQGPLANGAKQGASVFSVNEVGKMVAAGDATIGGALGVTGALASGAATITGTAHVTGAATIDGNAIVGGDADVTGDVNAAGGTFSGDLAAASLEASDVASGVATPTPAFTRGRIYQESAPIAIARVLCNGASQPTFVWGVNIASVVRNALGDYVVTLNAAASSSSKIAAIAQFSSPTNHFGTGITVSAGNYAAGSFHVYAATSGGGAFDINGDEFVVTVYGA